MFKLNFSKILPDFSLIKEKTDQFIHTWKNQNKAVYADFKRGIGKVPEGDLTTLYNMYAMMKDCVPPEAQSFYEWFLTLFTQDPSQLQRMMSGDVQWAGEHTKKIAQCMVNRQFWLGINLRTGKVDIYKSYQKDLLMVKSGTPVETWNRLPQNMRTHFIEQLDKLARNSNGCMLLSKLERKQLYHALSFFADIFILSHAVFLPKFLANNISPAVKYLVGKFSFLWMGDMETDMQEEFDKKVTNTHKTIVFAPHHGRKSGHIPSSLMDKLTPKLVIVGEAPSDELDYYSEYDTITQNTAGDILFETNGDYLDVFVSESGYTKTDGKVQNTNHGKHDGMKYLGSVKED